MRRGRELWEKKDKGSLGSCFSHIHTRPSTSEATADKNAKKKDEARITSRSCLWIAACILHIWWLCVCDESESPDCQPKTKADSWSYVSGALLGKMKWTIAATRHTKRHTHTSAKWKHFNAHTDTHKSFFYTHFHFKALACCRRQYCLLPHVHCKPSPSSSSCGRTLDIQTQRTSTQREASITACCSTLFHSIAYSGGGCGGYCNKWTCTIPRHPPVSVCTNVKAQPKWRIALCQQVLWF